MRLARWFVQPSLAVGVPLRLIALLPATVLVMASANGAPGQTVRMIGDLHPGPRGSNPFGFVEFEGQLYFGAFDDTFACADSHDDDSDLDLTDLNNVRNSFGVVGPSSGDYTHDGRVDLDDLNFLRNNFGRPGIDPNPCPPPPWPDTNTLWRTEGQTASMVLGPDVGRLSFQQPTPFDGALYFELADTTYGSELRRFHGTALALVKDISPGAEGSGSSHLTPFRDELYFWADDGAHGRELWKTDGVNTSLVQDINPGPNRGSYPTDVEVLGDSLYFAYYQMSGELRLWRSDGSTASPVLGPDGNSSPESPWHLTAVRDTLYFRAFDEEHGHELWRYDGSRFELIEILAGRQGSVPDELIEFGGALYFSAFDRERGRELWKYDGSTASLVADIRPNDPSLGTQSSSPEQFFVAGDVLYFQADDGVHGREIWRYDGENVELVADVLPGPASSDAGNFALFNGDLYFQAKGAETGMELWTLDLGAPRPVAVPEPPSAALVLLALAAALWVSRRLRRVCSGASQAAPASLYSRPT